MLAHKPNLCRISLVLRNISWSVVNAISKPLTVHIQYLEYSWLRYQKKVHSCRIKCGSSSLCNSCNSVHFWLMQPKLFSLTTRILRAVTRLRHLLYLVGRGGELLTRRQNVLSIKKTDPEGADFLAQPFLTQQHHRVHHTMTLWRIGTLWCIGVELCIWETCLETIV